jgi:glycosyltransferase involved in cell wall biosynthesis
VLAIAFDFPPRRTSGVYRITGLAKYLSQFNWQATVLTVRKLEGELEDPMLLARVPSEVEVVRTRYLPVAGWEDRATRGIHKLGGLQSPPHDVRQSPLDRWLRAGGELLRSCLYFPDDTVGWVPFGLEKAIELQLRNRFDVVYTTSPPRSASVIGLLFRSVFRVPWVAEFRDPWPAPRRPLRRWFERKLQTSMVRNADAVVVHSQGYGEELRQSYGVPAEKLTVVSNGFDEADFQGLSSSRGDLFPPSLFHLSHFGTVYPQRSGKFFVALLELVQECPELKGRLRVNFFGFPDEEVQRMAAHADLKGIIHIHPFLQHADSIRAMHASDGLLLLWGNREVSQRTVAGKLYEYLRVGRPILALEHGGETAELIEGAEAGWVVPPEDSAAIKGALRRMLSRASSDRPLGPARPGFVSQFRYDRLAARLAKVFNEVRDRGR